jgi:hypothetical protein
MERSLEVLDGVELDTLRAQQFDRSARISSAGVVVEDDFFHIADPPTRFSRASL